MAVAPNISDKECCAQPAHQTWVRAGRHAVGTARPAAI